MNGLLPKQVSLLEFLTSGAAIHGDGNGAPIDDSLRGIDVGWLRLEARFSFEKRIEKIRSVFPITFEVCAASLGAFLRDFAETHPPADIGQLTNAQQFCSFLRMRGSLLTPPWAADVAACEFACAQARVRCDQGRSGDAVRGARGDVRRQPGCVLVRCAYDIQELYEGTIGAGIPVERDTPLVVSVPAATKNPQIFEINATAFDFLTLCEAWTDAAAFAGVPGFDALLHELSRHGLIEVLA